MSTKTKSPLLSAPVLVVLLALVLAVAGVVYTHWTANLNLDAQVQTGSVQVQWNEAWTNDDGLFNDDSEPIEPVGDLYNGTPTSRDPMERGSDPFRWDKDVAECYADAGGDHMNVNIHNAYPSYNCDMTALIIVEGSVPVRATAINFEANRDGTPLEIKWGTVEGNFELGQYDESTWVGEIEGDIGLGLNCGAQLDPSGCQWRLQLDEFTNVVWHGPVSGDDNGAFADLDGNDIVCDSDTAPTECWVEAEYDPNNVRDPGDPDVTRDCGNGAIEVGGWLHVLQPAWQNANYGYTINQQFVNWNEFWAGDCTPGVPVVNGDGSETGEVACPNDYEGSAWVDQNSAPFDGMVIPDDFLACMGS